jgi:hypothetical protein
MPMLFPSRGFRRTRERANGLLFAFGVDDLSLTSASGHTLTFDRNGARTAIDSGGRLMSIGHDQPSWSSWYNTAEAQWEPTLQFDNAATNLCLQSENFGTTWAAIGTPTRTASAKSIGTLSLDLIGDDAAGTLEGYSQVVTYTGNAVKGVSLYLAAGTSTGGVVRLRDTTAGANRLLATITWASGVPTVTMTTGTNISTTALASGVYRCSFQTTSVTAANTNQLEVYPATTSALVTTNTGTVYAGGVQTENATYCHSYIKTTTATVSSVADVCSATVSFVPQDFTAYVRLSRPPWASLSGTFSGNNNFLFRGPLGSTGAFALDFLSTSRVLEVLLEGNSSSVSQTAAVPATEFVDVCAQFVDVATAGKVRIDAGGGFGSYSGTLSSPITAWASDTMYVGSNPSGTAVADTGVRRLIIASGARTLSQMRGLAV